MNTMVIIRGLPGSGKSTLAKQIYDKQYAEYCYGYETRPIRLDGDSYFVVDRHYVWDASWVQRGREWNQRRVTISCENNWYVIVDDVHVNYKTIQPYLHIANNYNYRVKFASPITTWAMNISQCMKHTIHNVPIDHIQKMFNNFEPTNSIITKGKRDYPDIVFKKYNYNEQGECR